MSSDGGHHYHSDRHNQFPPSLNTEGSSFHSPFHHSSYPATYPRNGIYFSHVLSSCPWHDIHNSSLSEMGTSDGSVPVAQQVPHAMKNNENSLRHPPHNQQKGHGTRKYLLPNPDENRYQQNYWKAGCEAAWRGGYCSPNATGNGYPLIPHRGDSGRGWPNCDDSRVSHHHRACALRIPQLTAGPVLGATLEDIVRKVQEKNQTLLCKDFWTKYPDIQTMAAQTDKESVVEILVNFAAAHKKHVYLFQRLKATILRNMESYNAPDLSSICHAFVVLGFLYEDFLHAMSPRIVHTAHLCSPEQLTHLLDAYASLRYNLPEALNAIAEKSLRVLHLFAVRDLMTHVSSFARLNLHNHRLFYLVQERLLNLEQEEVTETPVDNGTSAGDNISLSSSSALPPAETLLLIESREEQQGGSTAAETTPRSATKFTARDLTLAAYAFAKLGFHFQPFFEFVARQARQVIRDFTAHQIQMITVAFQRAGIRHVEIFSEMSTQAQRRIAQFNAESVALLLRSYSLFDIHDEPLFTRVVTQLPRLILTFRPLDIATTLNAFARLNIVSPALMAVVVPHITSSVEKFGALELQSVLHACAKLGFINSELLDVFSLHCDVKMLNPIQLTLTAFDLGLLGYRNFNFLMKIQERVFAVDFINPSMACQLFSSLLALNLHRQAEFQNCLRMLSSLIAAAWEPASRRANSSVVSELDRTNHQLPFSLIAAIKLCWLELCVISDYLYSSSTSDQSNTAVSRYIPAPPEIPGVPEFCVPINPTALLQNIITAVLLLNDYSAVDESLGAINVLQAAMSALGCFADWEKVKGCAEFTQKYCCSSGAPLTFHAGFMERESECGLLEISSVLSSSAQFRHVIPCLPLVMRKSPCSVNPLSSKLSPRSSSGQSTVSMATVPDTPDKKPVASRLLSTGNSVASTTDSPIGCNSNSNSAQHESPKQYARNHTSVEVSREAFLLDPLVETSGTLTSDLPTAFHRWLQRTTALPYHTFLVVSPEELHLLLPWLPRTFRPQDSKPATDEGVGCRSISRTRSDSALYCGRLFIESDDAEETWAVQEKVSRLYGSSLVEQYPQEQSSCVTFKLAPQDMLHVAKKSCRGLTQAADACRGPVIIIWGGGGHYFHEPGNDQWPDVMSSCRENNVVGVQKVSCYWSGQYSSGIGSTESLGDWGDDGLQDEEVEILQAIKLQQTHCKLSRM